MDRHHREVFCYSILPSHEHIYRQQIDHGKLPLTISNRRPRIKGLELWTREREVFGWGERARADEDAFAFRERLRVEFLDVKIEGSPTMVIPVSSDTLHLHRGEGREGVDENLWR